MDGDTIITLLTAIGGSIGGAGVVGWAMRLLVGRTLKDYDKKHADTDSTLEKISEKLGNISTDIAVMKTSSGQIEMLDRQLDETRARAIEIEGWCEKHKRDLDAQFDKIRQLEARIDTLNTTIANCPGRTCD